MKTKFTCNLCINTLLILLVIGLAVSPLIFLRNADFRGADSIAQEAIEELSPNYKPWASPVFTPPSAQIESLLFALQAALGAGVIGYALGFMRGKSKKDVQDHVEH